MESILEDFRRGLQPDVLVISSCLWDITRVTEELDEELDEGSSLIMFISTESCSSAVLQATRPAYLLMFMQSDDSKMIKCLNWSEGASDH
ncbi:hypothetical protein EYF80_052454 [Liparis tanakae]|uniref:Uncharacterized protein n=1 Tax=Liparis tanakae TaxID=230148 RepID=A0A4Z2F837_9TELE|nr:hypothetical protein EYF80_052454 [Liparis tanakae]